MEREKERTGASRKVGRRSAIGVDFLRVGKASRQVVAGNLIGEPQ